jgi:superfamily II DNA helicase RecQ
MKPCGICDFCAPEDCEAQQFRQATGPEIKLAHEVLKKLQQNDGRSTGKLFAELCPGHDKDRDARDVFEQLLSAMARQELIELKDETFKVEGREIAYKKAIFIQAPEDFELKVRETPGRKPSKAQSKAKAATKQAKPRASADDPVIEALKKWRLEQAKKEGLPAFRILTDKVLNEIAADRPSVTDDLLEVSGLGPRLVTRYGPAILKVLAQV